jgi:L-lactate dehydrogenase (cytochrome)
MNREEQKAPPEEKLTGEEVAKHNSKDSCWVIIHGKAYDVTEVCPQRGFLEL